MELQHPEFQEMLRLGCTSHMKVMLAFQTFMKLCEVDKLFNVEYFFNSELDLIYLSSTYKDEQVLHVPVPLQFEISPAWMHKVNTVLLKEHPSANVNILVKTPDSELLSYKLTEGLQPPPTPETTKEKKAVQEKIKYIDNELNKRKYELFEEAKRRRDDTLKSVRHSSECSEVEAMELEL